MKILRTDYQPVYYKSNKILKFMINTDITKSLFYKINSSCFSLNQKTFRFVILYFSGYGKSTRR